MAVSFREAMHLNCIECHTKKKEEAGKEMLDNCGTCHTSLRHREFGAPQMALLSER
jgi:mono/diheme cytochrome c family protein